MTDQIFREGGKFPTKMQALAYEAHEKETALSSLPDPACYVPWEDYVTPEEYHKANPKGDWLKQEKERQKRLGVRTGQKFKLKFHPTNPSLDEMIPTEAFEEPILGHNAKYPPVSDNRNTNP